MWTSKLLGVSAFLALWYFWVVTDVSSVWGPQCVRMISFGEDGAMDDDDGDDPNNNSSLPSLIEIESSVYFCSVMRGALPFWTSIMVSILLPMMLFKPVDGDGDLDERSKEDDVQVSEATLERPWWHLPSRSMMNKISGLLFVPGLFMGLMLADTKDFVVSDTDFAIISSPGILFRYYAFGIAIGSTVQKQWWLAVSALVLMGTGLFKNMMSTRRVLGVLPFVLFWGMYFASSSRGPATAGEFSLWSRESSLTVLLALNAIYVVHDLTSNRLRTWFKSFVGFYTFFWVWPSLHRGGVVYEDLPPLEGSEDPLTLAKGFLDEEAKIETGFQLLRLCCYKIQPRTFWISMWHGWFYLTCMTIDPLLLHALLSSQLDDLRRDLLLAIALAFSMLLRVSCMEVCFFYSVRVMAAARSALVVSIFEKSFEGSEVQDEGDDEGDDPKASKRDDTAVERAKPNKLDLPNLMSSDADKIGASGWVIFFLASWTFALVSLPIYLVILANYVGFAASFAGLSMLLLGGTFTKRVAGMAQPLFMHLQETRDKRSFLVRHAIGSMMAIKMFADETRWVALIQNARAMEMSTWLRVRYISAFNGIITSLATIAVPIVVFAWVTKVDKETLSSADAFTTLLIISQISWSVGTLPDIFNLWSNLSPSAERLVKFFKDHRREPTNQRAEVGEAIASSISKVEDGLRSTQRKGQTFFSLSKGSPVTVHITEDSIIGFNKPLFSLPETIIAEGDLVIVTGKVGTGKSCLLSAIAGVRSPIQGQISLVPNRAYVEQRPFLLNGSVRDNVLFGDLVEDSEKLKRALGLARLDRDMVALPKGVDTLVGDGGVQLSGGQRARVSFARALYVSAETELFVLDDLLASIDGDTGRAIWNDAILPLLDLQKKTIVMSSSFPSKEMLARCTLRIELIRDDVTGGIHSLVSRNSSPQSIRYDQQQQQKQQIESQPKSSSTGGSSDLAVDVDHLVNLDEVSLDLKRTLESRLGRTINPNLITEMSLELTGRHDDDARDSSWRSDIGGTISWLDFKEYWSRFGFDLRQRLCRCVEWDPSSSSLWISLSKLVLFGFILGSATLEILSPFWLAKWTETEQDGLLTYVLIQLAQVFAAQLSFIVLTFCAMGAAIKIHDAALGRLISAPMSVFDSIPVGRLMNIMSGDLRSIDEGLPDNGYGQLKRTVVALFQVAIIAVYAKMVLVVLPLLFLVYRFILNQVRGPSRDVKRIEAASNGPVYTAFIDALKGRRTIRAFGKEKQFCAMHAAKARRMATARVASEAIGKWAQALAVQTGCVLYFACGVVGVVTMYEDKPSPSDKDQTPDKGRFAVATLALLLTFAGILQRTGMDLMMGWTAFESSLVSIERMTSMMRLPSEVDESDSIQNRDDEYLPELKYPLSVEFRDVRLRYRLYRPLVLKGVTFTVPGGAKVAIVGRSGGGKSSLFQALLRVYPLCGGQILLGGVDVREIPLSQLRNGPTNDVRVVLQDALLPHPTLRGNISESCSDFELRSVLKRVGLQSPRFQTHLDLDVGPGGSLLSAGERQLVCLARAVVGSPKLLLCDECTSFVDEVVDEQVHKELLAMRGVTLLSILHRTVHLSKFDYIIEIGGGRIVRVEKLSKE